VLVIHVSWWTTGDESAGLNALFDIYRAQNPGVEIVNATVAGGAGSNAKAVLKTRMLDGDPPDSFQVHMGHELIDTWVTTGYMEPLDSLYEEMGFNTAFPKELLEAASIDGAGFFGIYRWVLAPLSAPGAVVVAIWQFTSIWNEFLFAVVVTSNPAVQPITVALNNMAGSFVVEWNVQMAGALLAALPTILVYLVLGRFFMRGLLAGSLKG
jgi:Binding-protein-dependent transport system inner membrane component/Bacterial extracellular solute-binding protein